MAVELYEVHCRSCGRVFGWTESGTMESKIYCDPLCAVQEDPTPNEERNSLAMAALLCGVLPGTDVTDHLAMTRQRMHQIKVHHLAPVDTEPDVVVIPK